MPLPHLCFPFPFCSVRVSRRSTRTCRIHRRPLPPGSQIFLGLRINRRYTGILKQHQGKEGKHASIEDAQSAYAIETSCDWKPHNTQVTDGSTAVLALLPEAMAAGTLGSSMFPRLGLRLLGGVLHVLADFKEAKPNTLPYRTVSGLPSF